MQFNKLLQKNSKALNSQCEKEEKTSIKTHGYVVVRFRSVEDVKEEDSGQKKVFKIISKWRDVGKNHVRPRTFLHATSSTKLSRSSAVRIFVAKGNNNILSSVNKPEAVFLVMCDPSVNDL